MTEQLAELLGRPVPRETKEKLDAYAALIREEADRQNLVASSTLDSLWDRHILDSAQLIRFEPRAGASWVDIGSGAGLPGVVIALLTKGPVTLVEPRRLRADFLSRATGQLGIADRVRIESQKIEKVEGRFDTITARAVATLDRLLDLSHHLSTKNSIWVLPKGRSAQSELAEARRNWQCDARIEPSCTDPQSRILVLSGVRARPKR